jgi:hyperosmotically inducible protein
MKISSVMLGALLAFGCSSTRQAARETGDTLASAYHRVASGASETARSGAYMLSRAGDQTVRVIQEAQRETANAVSDGWITTKVKTKLGSERGVKAGDINVDTEAGVVTLRGGVKSEDEAMRAIESALDTDGVVAVDSQLQWPARAARSGVYAPSRQ